MRKRLLKKIALPVALTALAGLMCGYTSVKGTGNPDEWDIDNEQFVYDYADEFTDSEELKLQEMCEDVGKELELDLIIVTATDLGADEEGKYPADSVIDRIEREYVEQFYLQGGYDDGILYLIDLDYDGIYVVRSGLAEVYISDYDNETILDEIWEEFYDYRYYESAEAFIDTVEDIVGDRKNDKDFEKLEEAWNEGGYIYYDEFEAEYGREIDEAYEETFFTKFKNPLISLAVAAVFALIVVLLMCISSNPKMTAGSRTYMKQGSFNVLGRFDNFTHTTTTSHTVNSSSGGSRGGGSRSRSSSSRSGGRSFSGGGRRR